MYEIGNISEDHATVLVKALNLYRRIENLQVDGIVIELKTLGINQTIPPAMYTQVREVLQDFASRISGSPGSKNAEIAGRIERQIRRQIDEKNRINRRKQVVSEDTPLPVC